MKYHSIRIEITGRCNLKCLYCHAARLNTSEAIKNELGTKRIISLIKEAKEIGCEEFTLIGGEPFVNEDWPKIVAECGEQSTVNITTNGHFFNEENLGIIEKLPQIKEFRISLDGLASHDLVRQGSSYKKVLQTASRLIKRFSEKKIVIQTTCNKQSLKELLALYEELKKIGVYRWRIGQLWKCGRTGENQSILEFADYDEMFGIYRELIRKYLVDKKPFELSIYNVYDSQITNEDYEIMAADTHPCSYHFTSICVKANGELTFCSALDIPFASVKKISLKKALKSKWLSNFKKISIKSVHCQNCRYIKMCGGGCRANAYAWLGDLRELDSISCCLMTRVEREIMPILPLGEQMKYQRLINKQGKMPPVIGKNAQQSVRCWRERR